MKIDLLDRQYMQDHLWNMGLAIEEAQTAAWNGEVPVGAVLVDESGKILAKVHNMKEQTFNPCGHAEILALQEAGAKAKNWRLTNSRLYVTLEPCPMCMAALIQARIGALIFGAYDPKGGAISLGHQLYQNSSLNHEFQVMGGVNHYKCSKLMSDFFREKRKNY